MSMAELSPPKKKGKKEKKRIRHISDTTFSLALDDSSDTCENDQLLTLMRGIDAKFVIT